MCTGPARLAYPDPVEPEYNHVFLKTDQEHVALEDVPSSLDVLTVPSASSSLKIIVDHVSCSSFN